MNPSIVKENADWAQGHRQGADTDAHPISITVKTYRENLELASSSTPEGIVDLVDDVGGTDSAVVEVAAVKTLKSLLAPGNRVELDINVTLGVGVDSDMDDFAVLLVTFGLDFGLQIFDPVVTPGFLFPINVSVIMC